MILLPIWACSNREDTNPIEENPAPEPTSQIDTSLLAKVTAVEVRESGEAYTFSVTILSPDTGCDQYANWWEVISDSGDLLYRRILAHSHVNEQPFTRSGGPVSLDPNQEVWVRAHMDPHGYGQVVMKGSVANGFKPDTLSTDFAAELAEADPQPNDCNF